MKTLSIIFWLICFSFTINAQTISWIGGSGEDWFKSDNWSTGEIPGPGNDVIIDLTDEIVVINQHAQVQSILINSNTQLVVDNDGILEIDGNELQLDGLKIIDGTFTNFGVTIIRNIISSTNNAVHLVDNDDLIVNNGLMELQEMDYTTTGSNNADYGWYNRHGSTFTNIGTISYKNIEGTPFRNLGFIDNQSQGIINFLTGITENLISNGSISVAQYGILNNFGTINAITQGVDYGIFSRENGTVNNQGLLDFDACGIYNTGDFTNDGTINLRKKGFWNGLAASSVIGTFTNNGILDVEQLTSGAVIQNIFPSVTINHGTIDTDNNRYGIQSSGYFTNYGTIDLNDIDRGALSNSIGSQFINYGSILINDVRGPSYETIVNRGNFINQFDGTVKIRNVLGTGLYLNQISSTDPIPQFTNWGSIDIDSVAMDKDAVRLRIGGRIDQEGVMTIGSNTSGIDNGFGCHFDFESDLTTPYFINRGDLAFGYTLEQSTINGDFENYFTGKISCNVAGFGAPGSPGGFDQLVVSGDIVMDGTFEANYLNGYVPSQNHVFNLISFTGNSIGFFDTYSGTPYFQYHQPNYTQEGIFKVAYEECGGAIVENDYLSQGNWSYFAAWSEGHYPYPCETVVISGQANNPDTVFLDVNEKISNLILSHAVLIVEAGKTLRIYPEFGTEEAISLFGNSKVVNNGSIIIGNVKETEAIYIAGGAELINHGSIEVENVIGTGAKVIRSYGNIKFSESGSLNATNLLPASYESGVALTTFGHVEMDGIFTSEGGFYVAKDTSEISGSGSFYPDSSFINGIIAPGSSAGELYIDKKVTLSSISNLKIEIAGDAGAGSIDGHDRLRVGGLINIDGILNVKTINGYQPTITDKIDFIFANSINGNFASINLEVPIEDWFISTSDPKRLTLLEDLDCENEFVTWTGGGDGESWLDYKNWQYLKVPKGCHRLDVTGVSEIRIIPDELANAKSLTLSNSNLAIYGSGVLNLDGGNDKVNILMVDVNSEVYNEGELNVSNNNYETHHGIYNNGNIDNYGTINVFGIKGINSHGLKNLGSINNYDSLRIASVEQDYAFTNLGSSSSFLNESNATIQVENSFGGIWIQGSSGQFHSLGTMRFAAPVTNYTLLLDGDFTTNSSSNIEGATNHGTGLLVRSGNHVILNGNIE